MRCRKNGYFFADYDDAAVWAGDRFECEGCKAQVVVGVAKQPTSTDPADLKLAAFTLRRAS
jgi:hypothetical protein